MIDDESLDRQFAAEEVPEDAIDARWRAHAENAAVGGVYSLEDARHELRKIFRGFLKEVDSLKNDTALALVHAVRATTGSGKTQIAIEVLARWLQANPDRTCVYAVPRHDLGENIVEQFTTYGIDARLYRGREADDPDQPGEQMCQDLERVRIAVTAGIDVQKSCCIKGENNCDLVAICGYQGQFADAPQVWVVAAMLPEVAVGVLRNTKHELFAQALAEGNTTVAAYAAAGYKRNRSHASRLVANGSVSARVRELQSAVAEQHVITQVEALRELRKIGFARINKAVKWGGRKVHLIDSDKLDDDTLAAIGEVSESADGALKIKLLDKKGALELAGKIQGWYDHEEAKQQTQINIVISRRESEGRL
jgi:phage terminase small subunit